MWRKELSCNNMWVEIVERNFSKNSLKNNLFVVLSFNAHIQGPKPWWREKAKHLLKNRLKNMARRKSCLRQRRPKRCYSGWRWTPMNSNGPHELVWKGLGSCNALHQKKTCYKTFCKPRKRQKMEESKDKFVVKKFWLTKYLFMNNLVFLVKG
jgi:hypothetical protein